MDDFLSRLPPVGQLAWNHLDRISRLLCDPDRDTVSIDAEVNWLYVILAERLETQKDVKLNTTGKSANTTFSDLAARLMKGYTAERDLYPDEETWRLSIRMDMSSALVGGAVRAGLFDATEKPHSSYTGRAGPDDETP